MSSNFQWFPFGHQCLPVQLLTLKKIPFKCHFSRGVILIAEFLFQTVLAATPQKWLLLLPGLNLSDGTLSLNISLIKTETMNPTRCKNNQTLDCCV